MRGPELEKQTRTSKGNRENCRHRHAFWSAKIPIWPWKAVLTAHRRDAAVRIRIQQQVCGIGCRPRRHLVDPSFGSCPGAAGVIDKRRIVSTVLIGLIISSNALIYIVQAPPQPPPNESIFVEEVSPTPHLVCCLGSIYPLPNDIKQHCTSFVDRDPMAGMSSGSPLRVERCARPWTKSPR